MSGARSMSGTIVGSVFADWNGNGMPDPGEDALAGIPVRLGASSNVISSRNGQFSFLNVPVGTHDVGLDLNAVPVDYDAPAAPDVTVDVARDETRRIALALIPLGTIAGRVVQDANRNGKVDADDPVIEDVVITLDAGARSELARNGGFSFTAVRAGAHTLQLLKESLPDGAAVVGETMISASITREQPRVDVVFLVGLEKRPEIRRVFKSRSGER